MRYIIIITVVLFLISCKKEIQDSEVLPEKPATDSVAKHIILADGKKSTQELNVLLSQLTENKHKIQQQLKSLSAEDANKLYESYLAENSERVMRIQEHEQHLLETNNYYSYFYNEKGESISPPDSIAKKVTMLGNAGLELWEIGEGYTDIRTKPEFYMIIFGNYVTEDYREFIRLTAEDDKELYSADAGLAISFEDVGKRVLNWERFVHTYPKSKLIQKATNTYTEYQHQYLFGLDNTPTMEYPDTKPYPENITEFKRFIAQNPDSFTSKLIKIVLSNTITNYDRLREVITKEQENNLPK